MWMRNRGIARAQRSGEGYSPSFYEAYGYNDRGELTSAEYHAAVYPATNHVSASDHGFDYDPIGNRRQATQALAGFSPEYYCTNALNQILTIDDADTCPPGSPNKSLGYDADGNMTGDGDLTLVYDAENRLVEVAPASPGSGDKKAVLGCEHGTHSVITLRWGFVKPGL
ncbi:MAG: hypothetical protein IPM18_11740 [Phycisphaerales bacterium]|nr:hypothetical protein [Phycisphaerales bacterium]